MIKKKNKITIEKGQKTVFSLELGDTVKQILPLLLRQLNTQQIQQISFLLRYLLLRQESKDLYWKSNKSQQGRSHQQVENEG